MKQISALQQKEAYVNEQLKRFNGMGMDGQEEDGP
jgi:hypothetical protein